MRLDLGVGGGLLVVALAGCADGPPDLGRGLTAPAESVGKVQQATHGIACEDPLVGSPPWTCSIHPSADTTLYEDQDGMGIPFNYNNGVINAMCVGNAGGLATTDRRAALKFSLATIPAAAEITAASLTIRVARGRALAGG